MNRRVVVTGLGVVSSVGIGKDAFWENITKGRSGISEVTLFDTSSFNRHYAGEIKNFNPLDFIPQKILKFLGRSSQFGCIAAILALNDARIELKNLRQSRMKTSVIIGFTIPEEHSLDTIFKNIIRNKLKEINKYQFLKSFTNSVSNYIALLLNIENNINYTIPNACAAGNFCISYGFDLIKNGQSDFVIVGGADSLSRIAFNGFQTLHAMAKKECAPFDKNREGMLLGEGAGILIIESLENAKKRNAKIYAEIMGYGISCDAHHMTIPKKDGIKKAMEKALINARLKPQDIDYISAHGTGTLANDVAEASAIKEIFKSNYKNIPTSSIKSMLGHSLGAASAIEAVACCLALDTQTIPPTINFKTPDPECDIDCVPNKARKSKLTTVLNNGFAFGGNNCCVVFRRINNES